MTKNVVNSAEVICLATGTKCISGNHLSLGGESLCDCHAEILARRCFKKYCYKQLMNTVKNEPSIFIKHEKLNKYKLSDDIEFHLYINTAPCGESRNALISNVLQFTGSNAGKLRIKIENGAGSVLAFGREMQTFDGIVLGERLITMSCADKVTRWNVLGIQGNLLSNLIEPIYLNSISIGSLFGIDGIKQTIYGRIENIIGRLPPGYK